MYKIGNSECRELFTRYSNNPILSASDWPYCVNSVFNAGATIVDGETLLLVRVEDKRGISHLTVARSKDGFSDWKVDSEPTFAPNPENYPEEIWGIEDPRVTKLDEGDIWGITYTSYSVGGPLVSLATTRDFRQFKRLGCLTHPENKDAALFPCRFKGRWAMIHRPSTTFQLGAHIWISFSPDMKHWGDHHLLIPARRGAWWDANKIGLNPPPLRTDEGWLILYHGVRETAAGSLYRLGLVLLDLDDPGKLIHRSDEWVFGPDKDYERMGDIADIVFPCGWVLDEKKDEIRLYYGAADTVMAVATASFKNVMSYIKSCPKVDMS
ncbi:MAG: hypothetical protein V3V70_04715 [Candidatus Scalindua sp.]